MAPKTLERQKSLTSESPLVAPHSPTTAPATGGTNSPSFDVMGGASCTTNTTAVTSEYPQAADGQPSQIEVELRQQVVELTERIQLLQQQHESNQQSLTQRCDALSAQCVASTEALDTTREQLRQAEWNMTSTVQARDATIGKLQTDLLMLQGELSDLHKSKNRVEKALADATKQLSKFSDEASVARERAAAAERAIAGRGQAVVSCDHCAAVRAEGERFRKQNIELRAIIGQMEEEERAQIPYAQRVRPLNKGNIMLKQQLQEALSKLSTIKEQEKGWAREKSQLEGQVKGLQVQLARSAQLERRVMELEVQNELLVSLVQNSSSNHPKPSHQLKKGPASERMTSTLGNRTLGQLSGLSNTNGSQGAAGSRGPRLLPPLLSSPALDGPKPKQQNHGFGGGGGPSLLHSGSSEAAPSRSLSVSEDRAEGVRPTHEGHYLNNNNNNNNNSEHAHNNHSHGNSPSSSRSSSRSSSSHSSLTKDRSASAVRKEGSLLSRVVSKVDSIAQEVVGAEGDQGEREQRASKSPSPKSSRSSSCRSSASERQQDSKQEQSQQDPTDDGEAALSKKEEEEERKDSEKVMPKKEEEPPAAAEDASPAWMMDD